MSRVGAERVAESWRQLAIYRQRYEIEDQIEPLSSLEQSIKRRQARTTGLTRTLEALQQEVEKVRCELGAVQTEIAGSRAAGALLIDEILDRVREETGEAWSPAAIRGFRIWRIAEGKVMGNQVHWPEPALTSRCLRDVPGEDIPHSVDRCGPPACGIYAVKRLDLFPDDVASGRIDKSIVGVVAMRGKVIEHELGYRAAEAEVVALTARIGDLSALTEDPSQIRAIFDDPTAALDDMGERRQPEPSAVRELLETARAKEEQWT
ncbi:MAG: hypothetical protein PVG83_01090 [Acidimicrobiia bacterium]|jgi:hypothetical protein